MCTCLAGCEACSPPPEVEPLLPVPFVSPERWRILLDVCRQMDDRANHGAGPKRKDA